jgi:AraC-like DNA-binding protein
MTDLDLMRACVFGGPPPDTAYIAGLTRGSTHVVALQSLRLPRAPQGTRWLRLHPGSGYLLGDSQGALARLRVPPGGVLSDIQVLRGGLVPALQSALISLRRHELADLARRQVVPPSLAREHEARELLVGLLLRGGDWEPAWRWWSEQVLLRHQVQIHALRRKVLELVTQATRELDMAPALAYPFVAFVQAIMAAYTLPAVMEAALLHLRILAPLLRHEPVAVLPRVLRSAVEWAMAHVAEGATLSGAARQVGVSQEHLARLARRHLATTFAQYLITLRLAEAKRLLRDTDATLPVIAHAVGIRSSEHFQRLFRLRVGMSPGRWRLSSEPTGEGGGLPR